MNYHCEKTASALPSEAEISSLSEGACPVDWALGVVRTAHGGACGKGTLCRDGIWQLLQIIGDIAWGKGRPGDLELLRELCETIVTAADCALSHGAASRVLSSLDRHGEEWAAHLTRKRCAALVCPGTYTLHVNPALCTGCGACAQACEAGSIAGGEGLIHVIDSSLCTRCGLCASACPAGAVQKAGAVKPRCPDGPVPVGSFAGAGGGGVRRRRRGGE